MKASQVKKAFRLVEKRHETSGGISYKPWSGLEDLFEENGWYGPQFWILVGLELAAIQTPTRVASHKETTHADTE